MSIPVITIIAKSGSGKTTCMEKLIQELCRRGYRLATVKHHSHSGFEIDHPGKDSWRHARAGSRHVIIAAPDKIASYRLLDHELCLDEIIQDVHDVDLILAEGYKRAGKPTIEVLRAEVGLELIAEPDMLLAVITDTPVAVAAPQFSFNEIYAVADLIEARFLNRQTKN